MRQDNDTYGAFLAGDLKYPPQNLPGTTAEYPNWRHKTRFTVEEMLRGLRADDYGGMYRQWLERTGRLNRT